MARYSKRTTEGYDISGNIRRERKGKLRIATLKKKWNNRLFAISLIERMASLDNLREGLENNVQESFDRQKSSILYRKLSTIKNQRSRAAITLSRIDPELYKLWLSGDVSMLDLPALKEEAETQLSELDKISPLVVPLGEPGVGSDKRKYVVGGILLVLVYLGLREK